MKGFIIYPTYINQDEKTFIQLFGKLESGKSFVTTNEFKPYFFIKTSDLKGLKKELKSYSTEPTDLTNFQGDKVTKIIANNSTELNKLNKAIRKNVDTYEADIKPHQQFLIENDILTDIEISGDAESSEKVDNIYNNPEIKPTQTNPKLKVISIDTESDKSAGELFCVGISSDNYRKNFMVTKHKLKDTISCETEEEALQKFKDEIIKLDPDIITGWNLIDFDLDFLKKLFIKNKIQFDLGRTNTNVRLRTT